MKTKRRSNVVANVSKLILPAAAPAAAGAAAAPAVSAADLVTRANGLLDLESQVALFLEAQPGQLDAERTKLVNDLLTATGRTTASIATRFETFAATAKTLEQQSDDLKGLLPVLERATNDFAKTNIDAIKTALEQRRQVLLQARTQDEVQTVALGQQIKAIEERLHHFTAIAGKA